MCKCYCTRKYSTLSVCKCRPCTIGLKLEIGAIYQDLMFVVVLHNIFPKNICMLLKRQRQDNGNHCTTTSTTIVCTGCTLLYDRKEELSIRFELFSYRIRGFKPNNKELKNMQFDKKSIRIIFSHFAITEDERMGSI